MDDVLARQHHAVGALGLRGLDEKRESSVVEHLLQSLGVGDAADCCAVALGAGVSHRMLRSPVMKLSRNVSALAVALVVNVLLVILLTPLGFETRPSADLKTVGYIAIGTIFAGLILDVASFALLFRRVRLASSLAIVGSILLFFPIFGDQTGSFFSLPIPPVVHTLEYIFIPVLLVTLFLASKVYRDSRPSPS
jgi:hypothetical protein